MKEQTFGNMIAALRKEKGMTQLQLAEEMGVTDKAVSKWERNLSFPDIQSIPKLAEILDVTVDELMQVKKNTKSERTEASKIIHLALKGIALAMGIAVTVLSCMNEIKTNEAISMLGIGLACLAMIQLSQKEE